MPNPHSTSGAGEVHAFEWQSRRNLDLEARIVFEEADSVDLRIRMRGDDSDGVAVRLPKETFTGSYALRLAQGGSQ